MPSSACRARMIPLANAASQLLCCPLASFLVLRAAMGPAAAARAGNKRSGRGRHSGTDTRSGPAGYGKCVSGNSPYTVELTKANNRRGQYCWTITQAEDACTRKKCCGDTPDQFVLRNLGEEGAGLCVLQGSDVRGGQRSVVTASLRQS